MTAGWHGEAPGSRAGLAVIVGALSLVAAVIAVLPLLLPSPQVVAEGEQDRGVGCDDAIRSGTVVVDSSTLFDCPELFDGNTVAISGEAIGDVFKGPGDRHWVQVNDDVYSRVGPLDSHDRTLGTNSGVAVLLPPGRTPGMLGGPGTQGDRLRIVGEFQFAAKADQGGPAIIADRVMTIGQGHELDNPPARRLQVAAPLMVVIRVALGVAVTKQRARRHL